MIRNLDKTKDAIGNIIVPGSDVVHVEYKLYGSNTGLYIHKTKVIGIRDNDGCITIAVEKPELKRKYSYVTPERIIATKGSI